LGARTVCFISHFASMSTPQTVSNDEFTNDAVAAEEKHDVYAAEVEKSSPRVLRVRALNPSEYTLSGTNTWFVGTGSSRILIDTGDGEQPGYVPLLREVMARNGIERIQSIVVTHWHFDHLGGVPVLQEAFGPDLKVYKFLPENDNHASSKNSLPRDPYSVWPKKKFTPIVHGMVLACEGATLKFFHTPGHAVDHVIAVLKEENSMFTADNVLGAGSSVFGDLAVYLRSLATMLALKPTNLYPGHGPTIMDSGAGEGQAHIQSYIQNRQKRIDSVLDALKHAATDSGSHGEMSSRDDESGDKSLTTASIVALVYANKNIAPSLVPAATNNTLLVLRKLEQDGFVKLRSPNPSDNLYETVATLKWQWTGNAQTQTAKY